MAKKLIAEAKIARSIRTLYVAMGPKSSVMGKPRMPSRGMVVLSIRSTPTGALNQLLTKGLCAVQEDPGGLGQEPDLLGDVVAPGVWMVCAIPWAQALRLARTDRAR